MSVGAQAAHAGCPAGKRFQIVLLRGGDSAGLLREPKGRPSLENLAPVNLVRQSRDVDPVRGGQILENFPTVADGSVRLPPIRTTASTPFGSAVSMPLVHHTSTSCRWFRGAMVRDSRRSLGPRAFSAETILLDDSS
jgi:hypothetical protein